MQKGADVLHFSLLPLREAVLEPSSVLGGWESRSVRTWLNTNKLRTLVGFRASVPARRALLLDVVVEFQAKLLDMGVGREHP